jgi:hypothetical protein
MAFYRTVFIPFYAAHLKKNIMGKGKKSTDYKRKGDRRIFYKKKKDKIVNKKIKYYNKLLAAGFKKKDVHNPSNLTLPRNHSNYMLATLFLTSLSSHSSSKNKINGMDEGLNSKFAFIEPNIVFRLNYNNLTISLHRRKEDETN